MDPKDVINYFIVKPPDLSFTRRPGDKLIKAVLMFRAELDPERCRPAAASIDSAENSAGLSFSQLCTSRFCLLVSIRKSGTFNRPTS